MMTKNEYEKNIARAMKPLKHEGLEDAVIVIKKMIEDQVVYPKYLMLLSNEINYYTIFNIVTFLKTPIAIADDIVKFLVDDRFLKTIGELKLVEDSIDDTVEIWIGETYFSLFKCDSFIVPL